MNATMTATACPKCSGAMWDNRATKRNPKQPDFKCKNTGCDGVIWPPRANGNGAPAPHPVASSPYAPAPVPPNPAIGDLPGDPASGYAGPIGIPGLAALVAEYSLCMVQASRLAESHGITDQQARVAIAATLFIQSKRG